MVVEETSVSTLTEHSPTNRNKRTRKLSRDKNLERIAIKDSVEEKKARRDNALKEGLQLLKYTSEVNDKVAWNKNYIANMIKKDPNFKKPLGVKNIICSVNMKYAVKDPVLLLRTTLMRYKTFGLASRKRVCTLEHIPNVLLDAMQLYIKSLQLSK